jgi:prepilin-type N-terminal cleavage/methylation domain-containing protein
MSRGHFLRAKNRGFTLAELAIVLVIVALLVGSLLVPLSTQIDSRNLADTRRALAEIRETILGYAVGQWPFAVPGPGERCQWRGGRRARRGRDASGCPNIAGVVPWATLGVAETDAWGRRYSYRVTRKPSPRSRSPANINECPSATCRRYRRVLPSRSARRAT